MVAQSTLLLTDVVRREANRLSAKSMIMIRCYR
jgi:hypothetical protein